MPRTANPPPRVPHTYAVTIGDQTYGPFVFTVSPNATWTAHADALLRCPDAAKLDVLYGRAQPSYRVRLATKGEIDQAAVNARDYEADAAAAAARRDATRT